MKKYLMVLLLSLSFLVAGTFELAATPAPWSMHSSIEKLIAQSTPDTFSHDVWDVRIQEKEQKNERREERVESDPKDLFTSCFPSPPTLLQSLGIDPFFFPVKHTSVDHAIPFNKAPPF